MMKLIFRYEYSKNDNKYYKVCESFKMDNKKSRELGLKKSVEIIYKENILDEVFLGDYIDSLDVNWIKDILDKLENTNIKNYNISSEAYEALIKNDSVIIRDIVYEEGDDEVRIDKKKVSYAIKKWIIFLEKNYDMNYQEIINLDNI